MSDWINRRGGGDMSNYVLSGRKQISLFVGRSWNTVLDWIATKNFPAAKIDGVWESHPELIDQWRRKMIRAQGGRK